MMPRALLLVQCQFFHFVVAAFVHVNDDGRVAFRQKLTKHLNAMNDHHLGLATR